MPGTLYLVATPIGNLEDITFRAVRLLKEVDLIACEDTRQTRRLLDHYGVQTPLVSYHEHNEQQRASDLVERICAGASVAVVSDAGMPLLADPGYRVVRAAIAAGIRVEPVPGPSAAIAALSASGLPTDAFRFGGFLPARASQRRRVLEAARSEQTTMIFYEAPHRILQTLADIAGLMPTRPVVVARELTKVHEEFLRGTAAELLRDLQERPAVKGEITLLIGKQEAAPPDETPLEQAVAEAMRQGLARMEAIKAVARRRSLSKSEVYRKLEGR